jgi:hypothetical protein
VIESQLTLIRALIPQSLHSKTWIAGSAAIAPQTAADIDVWVFCTLEELGQLTLARVRQWPTFAGVSVNGQQLDGTAGEGHEEGSEGGKWTDLGVYLIGNVRRYGSDQPIQVLAVDTEKGAIEGITELLENFDISTHQWAIDISGQERGRFGFTSLPTSTLPSQLPRVTSDATPGRTIARLLKLLARYGWAAHSHPDIPRLQALQLPPADAIEDLTSAA